MNEYDLVIRGGLVVDATGVPSYRADIAVKGGRIAAISGNIRKGSATEIDASDCIVAPGAVDLHTHYDAQLNWDPYASLSGWFGITSLTIGQCGFGFAPTRPEDRELNMRMMNRIEAIPLQSMKTGLRWDWTTFPEYLDSLERQGLGLNVGALFPFSPLRGYVLGMMEARERRSLTTPELKVMKQLFYEGMAAGAFGFSTNSHAEDRPEDGGYLPSHVASDAEFLGLAEVLQGFGVGHIGWTIGIPLFNDRLRQEQLLTEVMKISGRPAHVLLGPDIPSSEDDSLTRAGVDWLTQCRTQGLPLIAQQGIVFPDAIFRLSEYNLFDIYPNWVQPLVGTSSERANKLRDPEVRDAMKKDIAQYPYPRTDWSKVIVLSVVENRNREYEGRSIMEIANKFNKHPLDAFLDLAIDEHLETEFIHPPGRVPDDRLLGQLLNDPFTHISFSDGGAHTKFFTASTWPIHLLANLVRDKGLMSLEQAHWKISAYPSWFADFKDRGVLRVGAWADIIVYQLDKLGFQYRNNIYASDFPGGERRLIQKPTGLRYTLVNGTVTFQENDCSGMLPGKLLRSYDMVS